MMKFPKGTITGAAIVLAAFVMRQNYPGVMDPAIVSLAQLAGAVLAGFGAMATTGDVAKNAPFFKLGDGRVPPWPAMLMAGGISGYAMMLLAVMVGPASYHDYYTICMALSIFAAVIGWRMWLFLLVERSKPKDP
jgi:hypothetical protein